MSYTIDVSTTGVVSVAREAPLTADMSISDIVDWDVTSDESELTYRSDRMVSGIRRRLPRTVAYANHCTLMLLESLRLVKSNWYNYEHYAKQCAYLMDIQRHTISTIVIGPSAYPNFDHIGYGIAAFSSNTNTATLMAMSDNISHNFSAIMRQSNRYLHQGLVALNCTWIHRSWMGYTREPPFIIYHRKLMQRLIASMNLDNRITIVTFGVDAKNSLKGIRLLINRNQPDVTINTISVGEMTSMGTRQLEDQYSKLQSIGRLSLNHLSLSPMANPNTYGPLVVEASQELDKLRMSLDKIANDNTPATVGQLKSMCKIIDNIFVVATLPKDLSKYTSSSNISAPMQPTIYSTNTGPPSSGSFMSSNKAISSSNSRSTENKTDTSEVEEVDL